MNILEWTPYNKGPCLLEFYHRNGNLFSGPMGTFEKEHGNLFGLKNKLTNIIVLINHYGEIAARTPKQKEPKS